MKPIRFAFPISKVSQNEDGTMHVEGIATSEAVDSDGDVIDFDGSVAAFDEWLATKPAVREQHDPHRAIGLGLSFSKDEKRRMIPVALMLSAAERSLAQTKVKEGILSELSVGGDPEAWIDDVVNGRKVRRITKWKMTELSLVDRGANPDCKVQLWKGETVKMKKEGDEVAASETPEMATCSKCKALFPKEDGVETCAKCMEAKADAAAAVAGDDDAPKFGQEDDAPGGTKSETPTIEKAAEDDLLDAVYILGALKRLLARETAEGNENDPKQIAAIEAAITSLAVGFVPGEAQEVASGAEDAAPAAETGFAYAEKIGEIEKSLASLHDKLDTIRTPDPEEKLTKSMNEIAKVNESLSKAADEVKGVRSDLKVIGDGVTKILSMPVPGSPAIRQTTETPNGNIAALAKATRVSAMKEAAALLGGDARDRLLFEAAAIEKNG